MTSQFKTAAALFPLAMLVIAFQNCSAPQFSSADSASAKALGTSGAAATLPGADGTSVAGMPDGTTNGMPDGTPPVTANGNDSNDDHDGHQGTYGDNGGNNGGDVGKRDEGTRDEGNSNNDQDHNKSSQETGSKSGDKEQASSPDDDKKSSDDQKFRDACSELKTSKKSISLASGLNIENHTGSERYVASGFNNVDHNSGSLAIVCKEKGGLVKTLNDDAGTTLVCGCDVDEIRSHSGKVVVVDGNVGLVSDSNGIVMVGGKIGEILNSSGKVVSR
jgi:hypothetical protein